MAGSGIRLLVKGHSIGVLIEEEEQPTFFVDATSGSDSNDGLTEGTAWQTLSKVQSYADTTHFTAGDRVGFKGGETFDGALSFGNGDIVGTTEAEPFKLMKYGTGYPTLRSTGGSPTARTACIKFDRCSHVVVQDLILRVTPGSAETVAIGIWLNNSVTSAEYIDFTIQRCDTQGFYTTAQGGGTTVAGHVYCEAQSVLGLDGIKIYDCIMHGVSTTSKDMAGVNTNTGANHVIKNLHCRGNHIWNMGTVDTTNYHASGILANDSTGAILEYNLVHDIGATWTKCGGPVGVWSHASDNCTIQHNEVYHVRPTTFTAGCDWNGTGFDAAAGATTDSLCQFNYIHDCGGSGIYHWGSPSTTNNIIQNNFTANNNTNNRTTHGEMSFNGQSSSGAGHVEVRNNEFYARSSGSAQIACLTFQGLSAGMPDATSEIDGNIFSQTAGQFGRTIMSEMNQNTPTAIAWTNNTWNVRSPTMRWANWVGSTAYTDYASWAAVSGETGGGTTAGGSIPAGPEFGMLSVDTGTDPHISLTASSITEGAAQGTSIGTLSMVNGPGGTFAYSVSQNSAQGRVQIDGSTLEAGPTATVASDMNILLIRVDATNGTNDYFRYFKIDVV